MAVKHRDNGKHGRQQLRNVTRTSRRPERTVETETIEESEESDHSEELEETQAVEDKGKAYNALLTLISEEHKDDKPNKRQKKSVEAEDTEIVGYNVEEEEEEDDEEDEDIESDDEDNDQFHVHFNSTTEEAVDKAEEAADKRWPIGSKKTYETYNCIYQIPPTVATTAGNFSKDINELPVKQKALKKFMEHEKELDSIEKVLINGMTQYKDINFPYFNYKNQSHKKLYALHAINHIYKTRDTILKNNSKLQNYEEQVKAGKSPKEVEYRDQGFTRPKVLILLPTRDACNEVVNLLIKYSGTEQQENKKRFTSQFYVDARPPETKPDDFRYYFKGNTNDYFTMGIKFTRKTMKIYSSFYSSDIIVASPIGLSMILEHEDKKKRDYDFLSSIEVVIVDNANQIEMQNWDHVSTVFKYLNSVPKKFHDADFSRIRMWSINDKAKYFTQKIVFSEFSTPNINSLVNKSVNLAGKLKFKKLITSENCIMNSVGLKVKQIFQRFESLSPMEDPDARFKYFTNSVLNSVSISTSYDDGLMIIVPSYFDYIRLKEYMTNHSKLDYDAIDEYSSQSKLTKARQNFISGKTKVLIYTERLHHFRRFEINGVKNILLYGIPSNPLFYREYLKFVGKSVFNGTVDLNLSFVKVIYSKWDAVALERIVGNERAPVLCNSVNEMYEFK